MIMLIRRTLSLAVTLLTMSPVLGAEGDSVIRARAGRSEIVITTTARVAGAIHSLRWDDKEFINSHDHGRQLQSAFNGDCGQPFIPEVFNPTEAGSLRDGAGERSTSKLLKLKAEGCELQTTVQMAFWLKPGEKSAGHPARNDKALSDHRLSKRVHIGHGKLEHAIEYDVVFTIPEGETHHLAQFEAVTGYMPPEFSKFWKYESGELKALDDGPGEQRFPVVLATPTGTHAMGIFSPDRPPSGPPGYGRVRFAAAKVVKWNCVFRVRDPKGVKPGDYKFRMFVVVGSLDDVKRTLQALEKEFKE